MVLVESGPYQQSDRARIDAVLGGAHPFCFWTPFECERYENGNPPSVTVAAFPQVGGGVPMRGIVIPGPVGSETLQLRFGNILNLRPPQRELGDDPARIDFNELLLAREGLPSIILLMGEPIDGWDGRLPARLQYVPGHCVTTALGIVQEIVRARIE